MRIGPFSSQCGGRCLPSRQTQSAAAPPFGTAVPADRDAGSEVSPAEPFGWPIRKPRESPPAVHADVRGRFPWEGVLTFGEVRRLLPSHGR